MDPVLSFFILEWVEATATLKRISSRLDTKWRQPYSNTCGYIKIRVAITLVRATLRCLRGSRVPIHQISVQWPQWEDGAGINLFRWGPQLSIQNPLPPFTSSATRVSSPDSAFYCEVGLRLSLVKCVFWLLSGVGVGGRSGAKPL